jgi:hypothetical protein
VIITRTFCLISTNSYPFRSSSNFARTWDDVKPVSKRSRRRKNYPACCIDPGPFAPPRVHSEIASCEYFVLTKPSVLIEPVNFPYYNLARFAAPNRMATVLMKHSPSVPQCADLFAQLFLDAGAVAGTYTNPRFTEKQASLVIADKRVQGKVRATLYLRTAQPSFIPTAAFSSGDPIQ